MITSNFWACCNCGETKESHTQSICFINIVFLGHCYTFISWFLGFLGVFDLMHLFTRPFIELQSGKIYIAAASSSTSKNLLCDFHCLDR